jgi:hypothetical protein
MQTSNRVGYCFLSAMFCKAKRYILFIGSVRSEKSTVLLRHNSFCGQAVQAAVLAPEVEYFMMHARRMLHEG